MLLRLALLAAVAACGCCVRLESRRSVVLRSTAAAAVSLRLPRAARAEDVLAEATFSAGDPRFMQKTFDELKYAGIKRCEIGRLGDTPAIRITYKSNKFSYKRVVGTFWRSCDPTSAETQFGTPGPTVIWTANDDEQKIAEDSKRRLQLSTEFSSPTFGPMFKGLPIQTQIKPLAGAEFMLASDADQDWYVNEPKAYEQARKKTGRTKWFEDAYKPVTVTACQNNGEGTVCGFVYFPCSDDNGCKAVTNGDF